MCNEKNKLIESMKGEGSRQYKMLYEFVTSNFDTKFSLKVIKNFLKL